MSTDSVNQAVQALCDSHSLSVISTQSVAVGSVVKIVNTCEVNESNSYH